MNWVVGWNMAGYSPDSDNVTVVAEWHDALNILRETVERAWDHEQDAVAAFDEDGWDAVDGRYLDAHTEIHAATFGRPFATSVESGSEHGLPMMYWIEWTDEEPDSNL